MLGFVFAKNFLNLLAIKCSVCKIEIHKGLTEPPNDLHGGFCSSSRLTTDFEVMH